MENKKVALLEKEVNVLFKNSVDLKISNAETLAVGIDLKDNLKAKGKVIKETKEGITKPMNLALKNTRAMFKPAETYYADAVKLVKEKIGKYVIAQEEKKAEKERAIREKIESGAINTEEAEMKIEKLKEVNKEGETGKMHMTTRKGVEITDESQIPGKYWSLNMVLVRKEALAGIEIPGVKVVVIRDVV